MEDFRNMSILILGGAGYIGSHLIDAINSRGEKVVIIDDLSAGHREACKDNHLYIGDYSDISVLDQVFGTYDIKDVFIFAAKASVPDSIINPVSYYLNNVSKLIVFMDYIKSKNVRNIVFSSSASVYGNPMYTPIDEDHPKNPISPYGHTKLIGETIISDCCKATGINYALIRYFNAAGSSWDNEIGESHLPEDHLIPKSIQRSLKNQEMIIYGSDYNTKDGSAIRDFIHVKDLSLIHLDALKHIEDYNQSLIINAGSGTGYSVKEVLDEILNLTGSTGISIHDRRFGDPEILVANINKASKILSWSPKHTLKSIVKDAYEWEKRRKF